MWDYFVEDVLMHSDYAIDLIAIIFWNTLSTNFPFTNLKFLCPILHLSLNHQPLESSSEIPDMKVVISQGTMSIERHWFWRLCEALLLPFVQK